MAIEDIKQLKSIKLGKGIWRSFSFGTKAFFQKLPRFLAERALLTLLILLFLVLSLNSFIFYRNIIWAEKTQLKPSDEKLLKFNEAAYQRILKIWQEREEKLMIEEAKIYPDTFR